MDAGEFSFAPTWVEVVGLNWIPRLHLVVAPSRTHGYSVVFELESCSLRLIALLSFISWDGFIFTLIASESWFTIRFLMTSNSPNFQTEEVEVFVRNALDL